jgi:bifunctional non-homologous end joining protein LigD
LFSRHATHLPAYFPDIAAALHAALTGRHTAILDGEIVVLDKHAKPSFDLIQRRLRTPRPRPHLVTSVPATFVVFDLLYLSPDLRASRPQAGIRSTGCDAPYGPACLC